MCLIAERMLPFIVHRLEIAGRHYLLLPKLNSKQITVLTEDLERRGYSVHASSTLSARSEGKTIHVDSSGICWSSVDPEDVVIPTIPDLLSCPKERMPLSDLSALYFKTAMSEKRRVFRMVTRLESLTLWDSLRASDECMLAPDEHAVAVTVMANAKGTFQLLTDYAGERPIPRILGRRRYFESTVDFREAQKTLRVVGARASRNSYLPRDGTLRFNEDSRLPRQELERAIEALGEWCSFSFR